MNQVWKRKWVAALRSGKYKQTHHTLRRVSKKQGTSYCCLGVLTQLCATQAKQSFTSLAGDGVLSEKVCAFVGLRVDDPKIRGHHLAARNDGEIPGRKPQNFKQIATLIEHNL